MGSFRDVKALTKAPKVVITTAPKVVVTKAPKVVRGDTQKPIFDILGATLYTDRLKKHESSVYNRTTEFTRDRKENVKKQKKLKAKRSVVYI